MSKKIDPPTLGEPYGPGWMKLSVFAETFRLTTNEMLAIVSPQGGLVCHQHPHYDDDLGNFENAHALRRWLDAQPYSPPKAWMWLEVNAVWEDDVIAWLNLESPWTYEMGRRSFGAVIAMADRVNARREGAQ